MTTEKTLSPAVPATARKAMLTLVRLAGLVAFAGAIYLSGRLGVEMARNRSPRPTLAGGSAGGSAPIRLDGSGDPLYLARSPQDLRRFFTDFPTSEERARADLRGTGIRRLRDSLQLTVRRAEADAVEVEINTGSIAGAVSWIHHSQLPGTSGVDPIIPPVPTGGSR